MAYNTCISESLYKSMQMLKNYRAIVYKLFSKVMSCFNYSNKKVHKGIIY